MLCPNCKTELANINGRYICSDCGKEVPESEVNVGSWGEGSFEGEKVVTEPGSQAITEDVPVDDSLASSTETMADTAAHSEDVSQITDTVDPSTSKDEQVAGIYTPQNMNIEVIPPVVEEVPSLPVNDNEVDTSPQDSEIVEETSPEEVPSEAMRIPEAAIDTLETESVNKVVKLPESKGALPQDPAIYRDPLAENESAEEEKLEKMPTQVNQNQDYGKAPMSMSHKQELMIVVIGIVLGILLLGGGLAVYFILTK